MVGEQTRFSLLFVGEWCAIPGYEVPYQKLAQPKRVEDVYWNAMSADGRVAMPVDGPNTVVQRAKPPNGHGKSKRNGKATTARRR